MAGIGAVVSPLHNAPGGRIVHSIALDVVGVPNQSSLQHLEFTLFGVRLNMYGDPGTNDSKRSQITQIRLRPV